MGLISFLVTVLIGGIVLGLIIWLGTKYLGLAPEIARFVIIAYLVCVVLILIAYIFGLGQFKDIQIPRVG